MGTLNFDRICHHLSNNIVGGLLHSVLDCTSSNTTQLAIRSNIEFIEYYRSTFKQDP